MPKALREPEAPARRPSGDSALPGWILRRPETLAILVALIGLFVQVVGYSRGWGNQTGAIELWYVGYALIIAPFAGLLVVRDRSAHQRLGAALALSLIAYASWLLSNPLLSTRFDENLHVTTLVDLVEKAEFFHLNSMLPVSPHFPGLELATAGIHWLTGLPLFACQVIVVAAARITFVTALFLLASRIGRSPLAGGCAVFVYAASPQFYFFNAQYSYQTVAIAMVMAAFYLLTRAMDSPQERPWNLLISAQFCLGALAITHHLTSWITIATLWLLAIFFWLGKERRRFRLTLITAEIATAVVAAWTAIIAPLLIEYLRPIFSEATSQLAAILEGGETRSVGAAGDGSTAPAWELAVMGASVLLWSIVLLPAGWAAWRRGSIGTTRARYIPLLIALAFPLTQASRFSEAASEIADRGSTFIFMAMALVVGAWLARHVSSLGLLLIPSALIMVVGGTIIGSGPDWQRVPGPYLAGAQQRSIDAESVQVAEWIGRYVPDGSNVAADTTFSRLLPNFADVTAVTLSGGFDIVTPMFISESMDRYSLGLVLRNEVDFIVVDTRLVGRTALSGSFYEGSSGFGDAASTITPAMIAKFVDEPGFELVLDSPIRVYDVRKLRGVPAVFEDRPDPGLPGTWSMWQVGYTGVLLTIGIFLRRRVFDLRRFRAGDAWRFALLIPAAMLIGAVGVLMGFSAVSGAITATALLYIVLRFSTNPSRDPSLPRVGWESRIWGGLIGLIVVQTVALAVLSTHDGLLEAPPLPPPASGVGQ